MAVAGEGSRHATSRAVHLRAAVQTWKDPSPRLGNLQLAARLDSQARASEPGSETRTQQGRGHAQSALPHSDDFLTQNGKPHASQLLRSSVHSSCDASSPAVVLTCVIGAPLLQTTQALIMRACASEQLAGRGQGVLSAIARVSVRCGIRVAGGVRRCRGVGRGGNRGYRSSTGHAIVNGAPPSSGTIS